MPTTPEVLLQSIIAFVVLFLLARLMGKRQMSQLTFFDYIVGITIGNIAAEWSLDHVRSIHATMSLLIWAVCPLILAVLQRKSYRARVLLDGKPIVIIQNGNVLDKNLKKARLDIEELMLLLREKDVFKLSDVEYALFEMNGKLSVMKKSELEPVTPKDLVVPVVSEHEPRIVIVDGNVMEKSLSEFGYSREWLLGEIMKQGAKDFKDVFVAQIDSNGNVYVDLYQESSKEPQIKQKPLLAATLKKVQADLEGFALQTNNAEAKEMYARSAEQLKDLVGKITPYLKQ